MKPIPSLFRLAAASLLATCLVRAQPAPRQSDAADTTPNTAAVSSEAKEKAEDAALLQQLDAQDSNKGPKHARNPGPVGAGAGGGGMMGVGPGGVSYRLQNVLTRQASAKPLLVRTSDAEPKTQAALEEDLSVMGHILDKAIEELPGGQKHAVTAMGIDVFFSPVATPIRSLYLDNYGAVFFLSVGFPLIAPPEKHEEQKPGADSAWEDARQELYGQKLQANVAGEPAEDYSQEKVDKLKELLLEALKNATNIRDLKPEEFVTLWVSGGVSGGAGRLRVVKHNPPGTLGGNTFLADQPAPPARKTVLTIRARKADIDAFAKRAMSAEDFAKHARVTTYSGDSAGGAEGVFVGGGYAGKARF